MASPELTAHLLRLGRRLSYPAGAVLLTQGAPSDTVLLVLSGRVQVAVTRADGREILVANRRFGDLVGELGAVNGAPRSATVRALTEVTVCQVGSATFCAALREAPTLAYDVLSDIANRFRDADEVRVEHAGVSVRRRVTHTLVHLAGGPGFASPHRLVSTQVRIADHCGASRESVSRTLLNLQSHGKLLLGRGHITLLADAAGLLAD